MENAVSKRTRPYVWLIEVLALGGLIWLVLPHGTAPKAPQPMSTATPTAEGGNATSPGSPGADAVQGMAPAAKAGVGNEAATGGTGGPSADATPVAGPEPARPDAAAPEAPPASASGGSPASPAAVPPDPPFPSEGGYLQVTFRDLSAFVIKYDTDANGNATLTPESLAKQIPQRLRALDGRQVAVHGFMIPVAIDEDRVRTFILLAAIPGCLYCNPPAENEYIEVEMKEKGNAPTYRDGPIAAKGTLHVPGKTPTGEIVSIYRMDADTVKGG